ncbi:hypothetical protein KM481_gp30 [Harp seal herpesvirus]|uniref:Uncharacterized protein n=1 Tax=phocid gammaherpesvirus 3 TaxID=2560643 RepID=A0A0R5Z2M4_9GAMA|nr:hypothetical protein KM481_gp30 [Harp seal herpesvirus]AJG42960.1 hypothetical protein [Harp seal herpesvirus]
MASSKNTSLNLISKSLEAEINKRASISLFDRFGERSPLFQKQFQDTQASVKNYQTIKQNSQIEGAIASINSTIETKYQEFSLLSKFNKNKIKEVETLCNTVTDLKEDFDFELQEFKHISEDGGQEENTHGAEDVADTILSWKLQCLPSVPK